MQIRSIALLFIALFLCLNPSPLRTPNSEPYILGSAAAAPISLRNQSPRASTRNSAKTRREIELVSSTAQSVTVQLIVPKSDFLFENNGIGTESIDQLGSTLQSADVAGSTLSFPGCNFTTEFGTLRLPMQSTLMSVPPDVDFQLRVIDKDFSTRKIEAIAPAPSEQKDSFFPARLAEIREAGWIRENRVLPIQLNPVQYNPIRREVRLYHRTRGRSAIRREWVTQPLRHVHTIQCVIAYTHRFTYRIRSL